LRTCRRKGVSSRFSTTRPGTLLKSSIPITTFTDWTEDSPFFEADTVAHCGDSVEGFYLNTLSAVDVATGWIECMGTWGKGQERITFTRSSAYKKNDSCHIEQKNWNVIRRVVGYGRYSSHAALEALNGVYDDLRLYMNFFQPVMKIVSKTRHGARVHKTCDTAQTPYQRLPKYNTLSENKRTELMDLYYSLNPATLLDCINNNLEKLWQLEDIANGRKPFKIHKIQAT